MVFHQLLPVLWRELEMNEFIVQMTIEHFQTPKISEIIECLEIGTYQTEDEARQVLNDILESADIELEPEEELED